MASATPIHVLMDMRRVANARNEAVDSASRAKDWTANEASFASRIWSRQTAAITAAILAEPPATIADALAVLFCLAETRDLHDSSDEQSKRAARALKETTDVAIHNCIAAIAGHLPSAAVSTEQDDLDWSGKHVAQWLPAAAEQEGR